METCYKVFTREVAEQLDLHASRWGFDPEITAQILSLGYRIHEVPISYHGRTLREGKKIRWWHSLSVLGTLIRYRCCNCGKRRAHRPLYDERERKVGVALGDTLDG